MLKEALKISNWVATMQAEYDALRVNHTWTLTSPPSDIKPIGCKWGLKNKYLVPSNVTKLGLLPKDFINMLT